jgi:hypothetical protein
MRKIFHSILFTTSNWYELSDKSDTLAVMLLCFFVVWDILGLLAEPSVQDVALFFGDILFLKHLFSKWLALRTKDLNVSLFMEGHVELFEEELIEEQFKKLLL